MRTCMSTRLDATHPSPELSTIWGQFLRGNQVFSHVIPKHQPNWLLVLGARGTHRLAQKDQGGKMWWSKIPQRAKPEKCFAEPAPPE